MTGTAPTKPEAMSPRHLPTPAVLWAMRLLGLAACVLAVVMSYNAMQGGIQLPGCGSGSSCDDVLRSQWSRWFGVPVTLFAAVTYGVMVLATFGIVADRSRGWQRIAWRLLVLLSFTVVFSIVWFVFVQAALIGQLCKWCMAVHALGGTFALLALLNAPFGAQQRAADETPDRVVIPMTTTGLLLLVALSFNVALVLGQREPTQHHRVIEYAGMAINIDRYPVGGARDAEHILVKFYDYTCPHCRKLHLLLNEAKRRYGDQIAIAAAPAPLDADCNPHWPDTLPRHENACELASLAVAVGAIDDKAFAEFDDWLFQHEDPPALDAARAKAESLVGKDKLDRALQLPGIEEFIAAQIELNIRIGDMVKVGDTLPKLTVGKDYVLVGQPADANELCADLERELGIKPVAGY